MPKKIISKSCFSPVSGQGGCCSVESMITVDERGQMVLPKEIREKAKIKPGDKFALISWEQNGEVCCISLIKAEAFSGMVKGILGPMMNEMSSDK